MTASECSSPEGACPIFPLHTVLFPGGVLPLRIFEPRYLRMVRDCLERESGFGVCLIRTGQEVGAVADIHEVGTLARIRDFDTLPGGLLGITAVGEQRLRHHGLQEASDRLLSADVEFLNDPVVALPVHLQHLLPLFHDLLRQHKVVANPSFEAQLHDAAWLGWRLAELLPLTLLQRQQLLEENDALARLQLLERLVMGRDAQ